MNGALSTLPNNIDYQTPIFNGFSAEAMLVLDGTGDTVLGTPNMSDGIDIWSVNVKYNQGPYFAGLTYIKLNGDKVGSTRHLPPIVSLQYHFLPGAKVQPFVGVGVNYTYFFDEHLDNGAKLELSDSWGAAFQAGVDVAIDEHWSLGADVRYAKINSDVRIAGTKVGSVDVDPTIYSFNLGYRF